MIVYAKETNNESVIPFLIRYEKKQADAVNVEASKARIKKRESKLKRRKVSKIYDDTKKTKKQKEYAKYLRSDKWHQIRERVFKERTYLCEGCGSLSRLQVHHSVYSKRVLDGESLNGLRVVCHKCHERIHNLKNKSKMSLRQATKAILDDKVL